MTEYLRDFIPAYAIIAAPINDVIRKDIKLHWGKEEITSFRDLKKSIAMAYFDPRRQ